MREIILMITSAIVFLLAGYSVLKAADRKNELGAGALAKLGLSFLIGLGAVSLQMFFYSLIGIPFAFLTIALPWFVIAAIILFMGKKSAIGVAERCKCSFGYYGPILFVIIASQIIYALLYAPLLPIGGWDAWAIWFLKAKAFYLSGGVDRALLTDPAYGYAHPDYPLMMPLAVTWAYTSLGGVNDIAAKLLYPMQYLALLIVFYYFAKETAEQKTALLFTGLLSITPVVLIHSAGFPMKVGGLYSGDFVGYADLALSAFFVAGAAFIYMYMKDGKDSYAVMAGLFLSIGAWTKNEGLTFAALGIILLAVATLMRGKGWRPFFIVIGIFILFTAPWAIYKAYLKLGSEYTGRAGHLFENLSRLPVIIKYIASIMFASIGLFSFVWWAYLLTSLINIKKTLKKERLFLHALLLGQLAIYIFVYVITPADLDWHLRTSVDRLLLQLTPLAMLLTAMGYSELFSAPKDSTPS